MKNRARHEVGYGGPPNGRSTTEAPLARRFESQTGQRAPSHAERLAQGLGWFSVGLGTAQLLAPRVMSRMVGLRGNQRDRRIMCSIGAREIVVGLGILTRDRPSGWLWSRVGGDVIDLGLLGSALGSTRASPSRGRKAIMAIMGITAADLWTGRRLGRAPGTSSALRKKRRAPVEESITVNRPREEVYRFWRDFRNLSSFMDHLESVEVIDDRRSRWTARLAAGKTISWEAMVTDELPNERISWRSTDRGSVAASGSVRFVTAPGGRGTEVHVRMGYEAPRGFVGRSLSRLLGGVVEIEVASELHRFKQMMEIGEVVRSDASIHRGPHPARPPEEPRGRDRGRSSAPARRSQEASPGGGAR